MLEYYFAAVLGRERTADLAHSALPDAPVQPPRRTDRDRRVQEPASPSGPGAAGPADLPLAGPDGSSEWDPCPCGRWGVARQDRHGCVAMCRELFPGLDQELDAWEAAHGWLYR